MLAIAIRGQLGATLGATGQGRIAVAPKMSLTDLQVRKAKSDGRTRRVFDGHGLYVEISPKGGKWWRMKYRYHGREKRLSFGTYPAVSLQAARQHCEDARRLLAQDLDPGARRRAEKRAQAESGANTFEVVAREWFDKYRPRWVEGHASRILLRMQNDLFPWLGRRPIAEVTARELLETLNRIVERGAVESAHRVLQNCGQVFRYAIATGRIQQDPTRNLRGALPPVLGDHQAAITNPTEFGRLLRAIDDYQGAFVTKCALRLAPLVFVRPGELRQAEWAEFDLRGCEWDLPSTKMKKRHAHVVPLAPQAMVILRELEPVTGKGRYLFPSIRDRKRPMSNNTILAALRRMGYDKDTMSGHGFRAAARTMLEEVLGFPTNLIEHQLAHRVVEPDGTAYNRTAHVGARRQMMAKWADYLDGVKRGSKVVPFRRAGE